MTRRAGVTLTEVLVAIFITGIGLMSLLVLFPLGALNMAQAIKDQRTADCSRIAESLAAAWDLRNDTNVFAAYSVPAAGPGGYPSYIAYVDPQGYRITSAGSVGGATGITRVYPNNGAPPAATGNGITTGIDFTNAAQIARWTTLQDELTFDVDGAPKTIGSVVERTPRYSWAWMCQQTKSNSVNPTPTGVNLTVIVYDRRPLVPGPSGGLQEEVACTLTNTGLPPNMVRLSWSSAAPPQLKRGTWFLDVGDRSSPPTPHGVWYRVVGVTPLSNGTSAEVELHMNLRHAGPSTVVVIDSVVEVFEKGQ